MNKLGNKALLGAAVAGLLSGSAMAAPKKTMKAADADWVPCYGINKCAGHGKCSGAGHACAGQNTCHGQGWLKTPKALCEEINGGSLTPPTENKK